MGVNKVVVDSVVRLDLTGDSVTPQTLLSGTTAHNKSGEPITGAYTPQTLTVSGTTLKLAPAAVQDTTVIA
nr:MAG TPA: hypothetical protein [Caudoviricetes sp.]